MTDKVPAGRRPEGCAAPGCCGDPSRRDFLQAVGLGGVAVLAAGLPVTAGPFRPEDFERLIPADKKLDPAWVRSLFERGEPTVYRDRELETIGMPVGGICAGQLYLGGDGRLWHWDVFNHYQGTGDAHYAHPPKPASPLSQGFALRVTAGGKTDLRPLDRTGFTDVRFRGEYPIGTVEYRDKAVPVAVTLEAFSPFIPLNADDSGLPATVLHFTLKNTGRAPVEAKLAGWLENAVCLDSGQAQPGVRKNRVVRGPGLTFLECSAAPVKPAGAGRPPVVFADFEGEDYGDWKVTGEAFGKGPARGPVGVQAGRLRGFLGKGFVNTYQNSDDVHGTLTSPPFKVERAYISFLVGGGSHAGATCVNLLVDDKVVRTATGRDTEEMHWANWDVGDLAGRTARIEIVDRQSGPWGHILVDQIEFRDTPRSDAGSLEAENDFGTMGLGLLDGGDGVRATAALPEGDVPAGLFAHDAVEPEAEADRPFGQRLRGSLSRALKLPPGGEASVVFVLAWHFPNLRLPGFPDVVGRHTPPASPTPGPWPSTWRRTSTAWPGTPGSGTGPGTTRRSLTGCSTGRWPTRRSWPRPPVTDSRPAGSGGGRGSAAVTAPAPTSGTTRKPSPGCSPSWSARPARCRTTASASTRRPA
jgi:hypothetical protein